MFLIAFEMGSFEFCLYKYSKILYPVKVGILMLNGCSIAEESSSPSLFC